MSQETLFALLLSQGMFNFTVLVALVIMAHRVRRARLLQAAASAPQAAPPPAMVVRGTIATTGGTAAAGRNAAAPADESSSPRGPFAAHLDSLLQETETRDRGLPPRTAPWGETPRPRQAPESASLPSGEAVLKNTLDQVRRRAARLSA